MAQRITCVDLNDGHAIVCGALQVELGRTYRVTGTVDTANVPRGTPIEFRITHTSRVIEPGDEAERGLQGQCVVYADGTVRDIDIRWTNFTPGDAFLAVYLTGDYCGRDGNLVRPGVSPGDHVVVHGLDFQPFDDTLWGRPLVATADVTEIRKAGAAFQFNRPVRAGLYANRDLWFRDLDPGNGTPLRITSVEPEWFRQHVTLTPQTWMLENGVAKNTFGVVPSAKSTPDSWGVNGTEINPWREGWKWRPNAGSPNNQGFEDRFSTSFADYRATLGKNLEPYDHPVYLNKEYDAPFNRDPAATGRPIEPAPGDTVVKCLSYAEPPARGENGARARVAAYIPVTCVAADVPAGSFRPYPGAADKTPTHTISDLDLSLLPDLPSPADDDAAPRWHEAARMAYYMQPAQLRQFPPNEGIVQSLATSVYSRPHTEDTSSHFAAELITDAFTPEQKTQLAYAVVQYGLDLYQDNLIRKIAWAESGGKLCKKPYAVLAAVLLDDAGMRKQ